MSRYDPIEAPSVCMVRVWNGNNSRDLRPRTHSVEKMKTILSRARRRGTKYKATFIVGMGLGMSNSVFEEVAK